MQDDRLVGAILAGLPTIPAPDQPDDKGVLSGIANDIEDPWIYDGTHTVLERAYGTFQIGQKSSPINVGLRDHSLRTPGQYQQNFPRELAITEAAFLAGIDPIQFRIQHTHDQRAVGVLESVRDSSGWQTGSMRPAANGDIARGQGVAIMLRAGTYWACVAQIAVNRKTGAINVEKITISVDPGIVVNPLQLKRQIEGGSVMGVSMTLFEEVRFDQSGVVVSDWHSYPIATMADLPEIKVVLINRPEVGKLRPRVGGREFVSRPSHRRSFLTRDRQSRAPASAQARLRTKPAQGLTALTRTRNFLIRQPDYQFRGSHAGAFSYCAFFLRLCFANIRSARNRLTGRGMEGKNRRHGRRFPVGVSIPPAVAQRPSGCSHRERSATNANNGLSAKAQASAVDDL